MDSLNEARRQLMAAEHDIASLDSQGMRVTLLAQDGQVNAFDSQIVALPFTTESLNMLDQLYARYRVICAAFRALQKLVEADLCPIHFLQPPLHQHFYIHPWQLHFQQDSVNEVFKDGRRLADVTVELAERGTLPDTFFLPVFFFLGRWWVSGGNRRLTVLRLLSLFRPDVFGRVRVKPVAIPTVYFSNPTGRPKFTTDCGGDSITVRNQRGPYAFVGLYCTHWPEVFDRMSL